MYDFCLKYFESQFFDIRLYFFKRGLYLGNTCELCDLLKYDLDSYKYNQMIYIANNYPTTKYNVKHFYLLKYVLTK